MWPLFIISRGTGKENMSLVTDLPAIFDQFSEARQKAFSPSWISRSAAFRWLAPTHLYAARDPDGSRCGCGFALFTSDETIEEAEKDLPRNLCPRLKAATASAKPINAPTSTFLSGGR